MVEHDQARAGAEHRLFEGADRILEPVEPHQANERRRLSARNHEPVEPLELLGLAHLDRLRAEPPQHGRVLTEVSLHSEDSDPHRAHCRFELQELGGGDHSPPPSDQQSDPDKDEPQHGIGERRCPGVPCALRTRGQPKNGRRRSTGREEREYPTSDHSRRSASSPAEGPRPRTRPSSSEPAVAQRDIEQGRDRDQDPVEVAVMEEPEQPASDRQSRRRRGARSRSPGAAVDAHSGREQREADPDGHDRRPVASARDQVGDEEPRSCRDDEDERREAEPEEQRPRRRRSRARERAARTESPETDGR